MANKLKESEKERLSALVGLKNVETQAKEQRKLLYSTELWLATEKEKVLTLRTKLKKSEEAAWTAAEATEAAVATSYDRGVLDTEKRLVEEVVVDCKDYVSEA